MPRCAASMKYSNAGANGPADWAGVAAAESLPEPTDIDGTPALIAPDPAIQKRSTAPASRSVPHQGQRHVAWNAVGEAHDLRLQLVAARAEMPVPQSVDLLRH